MEPHGWILADEYEETQLEAIRDFTKFPELVWLDRNQFLAPMLYGLGLWLAFSWTGLFWGFFLSTVLLWHGTFAINSVTHVFGKRVFETRDTSRNSFILAVVTMGEGWHNNHHHFQASAAQGFLWWQVDPSLYLIRLGRLLGIAKDLRPVPEKVVGLARERAVWHFSSRTFERAREAFDAAQAGLGRPRRAALGPLGRASRDGPRLGLPRLADLEASRLRAAARLEKLKADYAAALAAAAAGTRLRRQRAKALAEIRVEELRLEIEKTRRSLVEALERLVEASGMRRRDPLARLIPPSAGIRRAVYAGTRSTPRFANIRPMKSALADLYHAHVAERQQTTSLPSPRPASTGSSSTPAPAHLLRRRQRRPLPPDAPLRALGAGRGPGTRPGGPAGEEAAAREVHRATSGTSRRTRRPTSSPP